MKRFALLLFLSVSFSEPFVRAADSLTLKDIAGDYYFGDGLGMNCTLSVTVNGKFTFGSVGCLGNYGTNQGNAVLKNKVLHIAPEGANQRDGFRGTQTDFYPVRWGARMYLIPTNDIVSFCSAFNQGTEPRSDRHGQYYLRRGDADKQVSGKPAVPRQWSKFFLDKPVRGEITKLVGEQEAWLNKGSADSLRPGMILIAQHQSARMLAQVQIEEVEKERCRIKCLWRHVNLAVGQTVSSRFAE